MNNVVTFTIIALVSIAVTFIGCGLVWLLYVLSYSKPVDKDSRPHELTKKELDFIFVQIIENEKEFRALRWQYITAGSNARYL